MSLPEGWEWDYDGTRWFYRYKPTGIIQFHFPQPGDEFPEYLAEDGGDIYLTPEDRLASEQQVKRRSTLEGSQYTASSTTYNGGAASQSTKTTTSEVAGMSATGYFDPGYPSWLETSGFDDDGDLSPVVAKSVNEDGFVAELATADTRQCAEELAPVELDSLTVYVPAGSDRNPVELPTMMETETPASVSDTKTTAVGHSQPHVSAGFSHPPSRSSTAPPQSEVVMTRPTSPPQSDPGQAVSQVPSDLNNHQTWAPQSGVPAQADRSQTSKRSSMISSGPSVPQSQQSYLGNLDSKRHSLAGIPHNYDGMVRHPTVLRPPTGPVSDSGSLIVNAIPQTPMCSPIPAALQPANLLPKRPHSATPGQPAFRPPGSNARHESISSGSGPMSTGSNESALRYAPSILKPAQLRSNPPPGVIQGNNSRPSQGIQENVHPKTQPLQFGKPAQSFGPHSWTSNGNGDNQHSRADSHGVNIINNTAPSKQGGQSPIKKHSDGPGIVIFHAIAHGPDPLAEPPIPPAGLRPAGTTLNQTSHHPLIPNPPTAAAAQGQPHPAKILGNQSETQSDVSQQLPHHNVNGQAEQTGSGSAPAPLRPHKPQNEQQSPLAIEHRPNPAHSHSAPSALEEVTSIISIIDEINTAPSVISTNQSPKPSTPENASAPAAGPVASTPSTTATAGLTQQQPATQVQYSTVNQQVQDNEPGRVNTPIQTQDAASPPFGHDNAVSSTPEPRPSYPPGQTFPGPTKPTGTDQVLGQPQVSSPEPMPQMSASSMPMKPDAHQLTPANQLHASSEPMPQISASSVPFKPNTSQPMPPHLQGPSNSPAQGAQHQNQRPPVQQPYPGHHAQVSFASSLPSSQVSSPTFSVSSLYQATPSSVASQLHYSPHLPSQSLHVSPGPSPAPSSHSIAQPPHLPTSHVPGQPVQAGRPPLGQQNPPTSQGQFQHGSGPQILNGAGGPVFDPHRPQSASPAQHQLAHAPPNPSWPQSTHPAQTLHHRPSMPQLGAKPPAPPGGPLHHAHTFGPSQPLKPHHTAIQPTGQFSQHAQNQGPAQQPPMQQGGGQMPNSQQPPLQQHQQHGQFQQQPPHHQMPHRPQHPVHHQPPPLGSNPPQMSQQSQSQQQLHQQQTHPGLMQPPHAPGQQPMNNGMNGQQPIQIGQPHPNGHHPTNLNQQPHQHPQPQPHGPANNGINGPQPMPVGQPQPHKPQQPNPNLHQQHQQPQVQIPQHGMPHGVNNNVPLPTGPQPGHGQTPPPFNPAQAQGQNAQPMAGNPAGPMPHLGMAQPANAPQQPGMPLSQQQQQQPHQLGGVPMQNNQGQPQSIRPPQQQQQQIQQQIQQQQQLQQTQLQNSNLNVNSPTSTPSPSSDASKWGKDAKKWAKKMLKNPGVQQTLTVIGGAVAADLMGGDGVAGAMIANNIHNATHKPQQGQTQNGQNPNMAGKPPGGGVVRPPGPQHTQTAPPAIQGMGSQQPLQQPQRPPGQTYGFQPVHRPPQQMMQPQNQGQVMNGQPMQYVQAPQSTGPMSPPRPFAQQQQQRYRPPQQQQQQLQQQANPTIDANTVNAVLNNIGAAMGLNQQQPQHHPQHEQQQKYGHQQHEQYQQHQQQQQEQQQIATYDTTIVMTNNTVYDTNQEQDQGQVTSYDVTTTSIDMNVDTSGESVSMDMTVVDTTWSSATAVDYSGGDWGDDCW